MSVRLPAVAGTFYDARPDRLERDVRSHFPPGPQPAPAFGAIVPHAGYVYSGPVAGAVYARLQIPSTCVILCPNHTGRGLPAALDPSDAWRTPLGDVPLDRRLADRLLALAPSLEQDESAHAREHSLEVQLPFLQVLRPDVAIVPVCLGAPSLALCREVGDALAMLYAEEAEPPLLLASSDMNHYESREVGRLKDDRALARVALLDPEGLFRVVREESISMCGFLPATALLFAARAAGIPRARVVARRDSGDETGDVSSVVGYAGVVLDETRRHERKAMKKFASIALGVFLAVTAAAQTHVPVSTVAPRPEDVATIDGMIKAYYEVVTGPAGQPRDWARDRSLYIKDLRFVIVDFDKNGQPAPKIVDHQGFVDSSNAMLLKGFVEKEIHRVTERFGPIAHVWSTYETRQTETGPVIMRGINSIELFWDGKRWWIANAIWTDESKDNPIPKEYLPNKK